MKQTRPRTIATLAVLAIGLVGTIQVSSAQTTAPLSARTPARARPVRQFLRALHQLNLSDEQKQQIRTLVVAARGTAKPSAASDLSALDNPGDPSYAIALQIAKDRAVARIQRLSDLQMQIYAVLTVEQKAQLTQVLGQMAARTDAGHGLDSAAAYVFQAPRP